MKVLYIGNFLDSTGWSNLCINNALAIDAAGIDIVCRNIKLNGVDGEVPDRITELLNKDAKHPDIVIQNVLPQFLDYNGRIPRNVCLYTSETSTFKYSSWPAHINTMDEAVILNFQSKFASIDSGVNIPITVINPAVDINKFTRSYKPLHLRSEYPDDFIIYNCNEWNKRKNWAALIRAFHLEFQTDEPVQLLIKTTPTGVKKEEIERFCNEIKFRLHLYPNLEDYKKEIIVCDHWSEENVMRLHSSADCFVNTSYGEAWGYGTIDALGMGKAVIAPRHTGFLDYLNDEVAWLIDSTEEPVFDLSNGIDGLFVGRENWYAPNINMLRSSMREAYENKSLRDQKSRLARRRAFDFSYNKVGEVWKNYLSGEALS